MSSNSSAVEKSFYYLSKSNSSSTNEESCHNLSKSLNRSAFATKSNSSSANRKLLCISQSLVIEVQIKSRSKICLSLAVVVREKSMSKCRGKSASEKSFCNLSVSFYLI